jgi:hypothetical protein
MLYHYTYQTAAPWDRDITLTLSDVYETDTPIRTKADYEALKLSIWGDKSSKYWIISLSLVDPNPLPVDIK